MWLPLIELLADQGYRVVAFDQRGYSPGARPDDVASYAIAQLVDDVFAVANAAGSTTSTSSATIGVQASVGPP